MMEPAVATGPKGQVGSGRSGAPPLGQVERSRKALAAGEARLIECPKRQE